jgi:predicted ATPase
MIRRVRIKGYKSLRDVEVELNQLTVCIGPNAAGKSNLFDALSLLSRMATLGDLNSAFAEHRGAPLEAFFYGAEGIESLFKHKAIQFTIEVDVELSPQIIRETNLQTSNPQLNEDENYALGYSLTVEMQTNSGSLSVVNEELVGLDPKNLAPKEDKLFLKRSEESQLRRIPQPLAEQLKFSLAVKPDEIAISPPFPAWTTYPEVAAFSKELSSWQFYQLQPEAMRANIPLRKTDTVSPSGANLAAFYNTLRVEEPQQYRILERALRTIFNIKTVEIEPDHQGMLQMSIVEEGTRHAIRVASEGTLRVLALLAIVSPMSLENTTTIGYEEPENGVHPRRLKLIADLFKNVAEGNRQTQVLINTHSPVLPGYFEPESVLICRKQKGQTRFIPLSQIASNGYGEDTEELPLTSFAERVIRGDFDE